MPTSFVYSALYLSIALGAINGLFSKSIPLNAVTITQVRSAIAALFIAAVILLLRKAVVRDLKTLALLGFVGLLLGIHWVTFFHSMQVSTIAIGVLATFTFPIMTVFLEAAFAGKKLRWQDVLSGVLVLLGVAVMLGDQPLGFNSSTAQGAAWGLLSAFLFASRNVISKYSLPAIPSAESLMYQLAAVALILIPFIDFHKVSQLAESDWVQLVTLGIFTTALCHTLIVFCYNNLPAKTVAMISCLQPPLAAVLGWLFLQEQVGLYVVVGGAIILYVAVREATQKGK